MPADGLFGRTRRVSLYKLLHQE